MRQSPGGTAEYPSSGIAICECSRTRFGQNPQSLSFSPCQRPLDQFIPAQLMKQIPQTLRSRACRSRSTKPKCANSKLPMPSTNGSGNHGDTEREVWIKIHKLGSDLQSICPQEAIDACLCWGVDRASSGHRLSRHWRARGRVRSSCPCRQNLCESR